MDRLVRYFDKPGRDNTGACLDVASSAVEGEGLKHLVVASTGGETGLLFARELAGRVNLVVVTHSYGFKEPNSHEMPPEVRRDIAALGATVYTGSMLTHSLDTAFAAKFGGSFLTQTIAQSLRRFGEGMKVSIECVMMAADAGLIPEDEDVLAVAGTARGADTVAIIRSAVSKRFLQLRVLEILAKPRS